MYVGYSEMSTNRKSEKQRLIEYDRDMLRSTFVSIFWAAITERRKHGKFTLQSLADILGIGKWAVSRWFSGDPPNWTIDTISDVAGALNLDLKVEAIDRATGMVIRPSGIQYPQKTKLTTPGQANRDTEPSVALDPIRKPPSSRVPPKTSASANAF
jgi:hypothetical protein